MRSGYDLAFIARVASAVAVPIIAAGSAASLEDFERAIQSGASAVSAGSMFVFYGKHHPVLITYPSQEEISRVSSRVSK